MLCESSVNMMALESLNLARRSVSKAFSNSFAFGRAVSKSNNLLKPPSSAFKLPSA